MGTQTTTGLGHCKNAQVMHSKIALIVKFCPKLGTFFKDFFSQLNLDILSVEIFIENLMKISSGSFSILRIYWCSNSCSYFAPKNIIDQIPK